MPNPQRGEVTVMLDGHPHTMRLSLGALAELEDSLDAADLIQLVERFEQGKLTAKETLAIIGAGLRGAGQSITDQELADKTPDGGIAALIKSAAALLTKAFAG